MRYALILTILFSSATHADALHDLVKAKMPVSAAVESYSPDSFAIEPYVPFQSFQFQYGDKWAHEYREYSGTVGLPKLRDEENGAADVSRSFRVNLKSYAEIVHSAESRRLSKELMQVDRIESENMRRYDAYTAIVNHVLGSRLDQILEKRRKQLQQSIDKYGARMGLSKISTKDILGDYRNLQRVESELAETKMLTAQDPGSQVQMPADEKIVQQLITSIKSVQSRLRELNNESGTAPERREDLQIRLDRINREIKWGDETKIVDRIEYGQGASSSRRKIDHDTSIQVTFNVPFLRFDRENRSRERALLMSKEHEVERKKLANREELKRDLQTLEGLAARIGAIQTRLSTMGHLSDRLKGVRDLELKSELSDFNFEMEKDAVRLGHEYFTRYLVYLRDIGALARNVDFLNARWQEL